ncbi:MAG: hypothetical protein E7171_05685 [Firmicutes bacterium]|jgi:hypothetical protein|nr:hypothetical protein [Bacillota bacterium]
MGIIETSNVNNPSGNVPNEVSKYSEDWVPIKNIMNGMIQLENGQYVTGIKVAPKNIFILDQGERDNIIFSLQNFYNMIDYEFWLVVADRPVDINLYLSQLQLLYQRCTDGAVRKLIIQDINKANAFMSAEYNVVDTEYFILFKEKRLEIVQKRLHNLIAGLANASINSSQVSNADLRMILDNFLNGGMTTTFGTVRVG